MCGTCANSLGKVPQARPMGAGHTRNCRAQPKCVKCGQLHWSKECTIVDKDNPETHKNIKYANYLGNHLTFSKKCPILQRRQGRISQASKRKSVFSDRLLENKKSHAKKSNFVPAPLPTVSHWINNNNISFQGQMK